MESNAAENLENETLTLEIIHQSFETDFDSIKCRLRISEDNLHTDVANINRYVSEIIQEERDQKKIVLTLMTSLIFINVFVAISAIIIVALLISQ